MKEDLQIDDDQKKRFGTVPNGSEGFGNVRKDAETFGKLPNDAESFRAVPKASERKEYYILTVREAARLFEAAGVARTERSIINWCQPNKLGVARLDNYFDPNERRYFISPQSVEVAIQEEKAKATKAGVSFEPVGNIRNDSESIQEDHDVEREGDSERGSKFESELFDLKVLNSGKDFLIKQMRQEREIFFNQLLEATRKVGELETKLFQLEAAPKEANADEPELRDA
jgi:hypothetical protein